MDKTSVRIDNGYQAVIQARSHVVLADAPIADGGTDRSMTPEELFLGALGACMAMTGKMYATRKGWPLDEIAVELDIERVAAEDYPGYQGDARFVHRIIEQVSLKGQLDDEQRTRIMEIMRKCPVRRIVTSPVFFEEELLALEPETLLD
ncbi:MAG: OsmC family protein [Anaerolineae bacterium]|jgi:putative redox protein|nr:OsmC family protein [Anaerolineae bacterium]